MAANSGYTRSRGYQVYSNILTGYSDFPDVLFFRAIALMFSRSNILQWSLLIQAAVDMAIHFKRERPQANAPSQL
jgi:hypothetical protein